MTHLFIGLLTLSIYFSFVSPTLAFFPFNQTSHPKKTLVKGKMMKYENKSFMDKVKAGVPFLRHEAVVITGEITLINGTTLKVTKGDKTYTVNTDSNTKLQRHYWGKSSLSEFSVGNKINVYGKYTDPAKTTILATLIRDLSIMKRYGVFQGVVTEKNNDNFVIKTKNRDNQTIYFISPTKFLNKKDESISYNDLQIGHQIKVKGIWDKSQNKVTEVSIVKDYSIPPAP